MPGAMTALWLVPSLVAIALLRPTAAAARLQRPSKPNVLYFILDDLRSEVGFANRRKGLRTPNMDKLASRSLSFDRMYVQEAVCSPSRNSFLTGRRPDTTRVWNFFRSFRATLGDIAPLPEAFKRGGWLTTGMGKVYHPDSPPQDDCPQRGVPGGCPSWSDWWPYYHGVDRDCSGYPTESSFGPWEACDAPDSHFVDGEVMEEAVKRLQDLQKIGRPWFLAVGFHKPHVPWRVPLRFLHMQLPMDECDVAAQGTRDSTVPSVATWRCNTMGADGRYNVSPDAAIPPHQAREYRRAYRAAVSWVDYLVGRVMDTLEETGMENETVVVLHGDHGWHLGEAGIWCKQTNFELAARTPFLIRAPWLPRSFGRRTRQLAELVDLFPTLLELAGLPREPGLEGQSLVPLLQQPEGSLTGKNASYTQYPRCDGTKSIVRKPIKGPLAPWQYPTNDACTSTGAHQFAAMGYSVREERFRYTLWVRWNGQRLSPEWGLVIAEELYDHLLDDGFDTDSSDVVNVAGHHEFAGDVQRLRRQVVEFFSEGERRRSAERDLLV